MRDSAGVLNWFIGGYLALYVVGHSKIVAARPASRVLFVIVPLCLLAWQGVVLRNRLVRGEGHPAVPFYERIESGDWWRLFWIVWLLRRPLASDYVLGFFLFTALVAVLAALLTFTASV